MENLQSVRAFLDSLDGSIEQLEDKLHGIITKSLDEVIAPIESPIEKIEVYNNYSYVLVSIIYAYLKSSGVNTDNHPIMKELERVKVYMNRHKQMQLQKIQHDKSTLEESKNYINKVLEPPSISSANFQGKHKRYNE